MSFFGLDPVLNQYEYNDRRFDDDVSRLHVKPWYRPNCLCEEPTGDPGPSICGFYYCTTCGGTVK